VKKTAAGTAPPDIQGYEKRLQQCINRIDNDTFPSGDKQLIKSYLKHMGAQGVSKGRVFKLAWTLLTLRRNMKCNFAEADRGKIEELMDWLNGTEFSANTKSDHKKILRNSTSTSATGMLTRPHPSRPKFPGWTRQ
jgi:hypothetical protein